MDTFFFQAEDGIRDWSVTGVQTCALPICTPYLGGERGGRQCALHDERHAPPGELRERYIDGWCWSRLIAMMLHRADDTDDRHDHHAVAAGIHEVPTDRVLIRPVLSGCRLVDDRYFACGGVV